MTRTELINDYTTANRKFEAKFMPAVKRALDSKVKATIAHASSVQAAIKYIHDDLTNPELANVIRRLYVTVGIKHANDTERRLRQEKGFGFNETWTKFILEYLRRFLIEKITFEVARTTRDYLLAILNESVQEGWGLSVTLDKLREQPFTRMQAARIVRTEVNRAANVGFRAQADTFKYQLQKEWVSVHDKRTRGNKPSDHASHVGLDGTTIDIEDVFTDPRNGDHLQQPGDPNASAESVINCRCRIVTKAKRDRDGNLIPKRQSTSVIYPSQQRRRQTVLI